MTKRFGGLLVVLSIVTLFGWLAYEDGALADSPGHSVSPAYIAGATSPSEVKKAFGKEMLAFSEVVDKKYQQVTVIDPKQQVISVYHIDLVTGTITLRSVRNIHWDLQMTDFNGSRPLPKEIQALSEQR